MSDIGKLKAKLLKLAEAEGESAQEGRNIGASDVRGRLDNLFAAIEEIVLPRTLNLLNEDGQKLTLTVKSRRLIRLNAPVPEGLDPFAAVFDRELDADNTVQMTSLAHLFTAYCAHGKVLSASATDAAKGEALQDLGVAVDRLRDAVAGAGLALGDDAIGSMESLTQKTQALCTAMVRFRNVDVLAAFGDEAELAMLKSAQVKALPHIQRGERVGTEEDAGLRFWVFGGGDTDERRTALAIHRSDVLLALLNPQASGDWIKTCQQVLAAMAANR